LLAALPPKRRSHPCSLTLLHGSTHLYVMLISRLSLPQNVACVALTEITNEVGLCGIRSPFPVCNVSVLVDIETEFLIALKDNQDWPYTSKEQTDPAELF